MPKSVASKPKIVYAYCTDMKVKMQQFIQQCTTVIKQKPALVSLFFVLSIIWGVTLKPSFYILGWDNFSSYFTLPTNIFRTFFATWREYRGVGVPSDSESVDLFRQLFDLLLHPFLPETLLDQAYLLTALSLGLIAIYLLTVKLFEKYMPHDLKKADLVGGVAAFFYLCNLNTLATFYFPMIMYINRFFTLPLIFLLFFDLSTRKNVSLKRYLLYIVGLFFASGSFVTATILITIVIAMGCFFLFAENRKRVLFLFLLYFVINAFWLLPFTNYTLQRAKLIRNAPTFISANEIQLNKGKEFYLPEKQLTLYHEFFDAKVSDLSNTQSIHFSTATASYQTLWSRIIIWLFPALYLLGTGYMLFHFRRCRPLLWIPAVLGVYLFLSMKEYSPLGFIYGFLNSLTPYFGVLFRFGDTKFHAFIAFSGSILAAYGCYFIFSYVRLRISYILTILLIGISGLVYYPYLSGNLIGWLVLTKLPPAYTDITTRLNNDQEEFRVLHLPFDKDGYWKSYAWGAISSSFLHFMLDHPLIDKTFEPGSAENAYLDTTMQRLLQNVQQLRTDADKKQRAEEFASLLRKTGVKYIIVDESVQTAVAPRGIVYWGTFNTPDVVKMGEYLTQFGMAKEVKRYDIPLSEYLDAYNKLGSNYAQTLSPDSSVTHIRLLELLDFQSKAAFFTTVRSIDSSHTSLLESDVLLQSKDHVIQQLDKPSQLYPFLRRDGVVRAENHQTTLTIPTESSFPYTTVRTGDEKSTRAISAVKITATSGTAGIMLRFYHMVTPEIQGKNELQLLQQILIPIASLKKIQQHTTSLDDYFSDWHVLPSAKLGSLRVQVGTYTLPLPQELDAAEKEVGVVAIPEGEAAINVLGFAKQERIDPGSFIVTENPNCFSDGLEDSGATFSTAPVASVTTKNQSTCFFYDLSQVLTPQTDHVEVQLTAVGNAEDLDAIYTEKAETTKPGLRNVVTALEKPNLLQICMKESTIDGCYNIHQLLDVRGDTNVIIPFEKPLLGNTKMTMFLNAKNTGYQKQYLEMQQILVDSFVSLGSANISVPAGRNMTVSMAAKAVEGSLTVSFPKALSLDSFYFNPRREGLYGQNPACSQAGGYKTYRVFEGKLVSYFENCFSQIFQKTNFSSDTHYFWDVTYNVLSGKYPRLLVADQFYSYADEYLSLQQGYPDVPGFKKYQNPELWYDTLLRTRTPQVITKQIADLKLQTAYGYFGGITGLSDTAMKEIKIHHDAENEGMMVLSGFSFQPLPSAWRELSLLPEKNTTGYHQAVVTEVTNILPSLWKFQVGNLRKGEKSMLFFNEGFDPQWKLYDSWSGVVFGIGKSYTPVRCDGFANCYEIGGISGDKTLYAFYTPERLMVLGWIITLSGVVFFGWKITKRVS